MKKYNNTLIVDDDPISCFINKNIIEISGLTENIEIATNGEEAIDYIKKKVLSNGEENNNPDLIFLDLNMPVMDGFEFLQKLELLNDKFQDNVEIVVLTSSNSQSDISKATSRNIKAYLTKPLTVEAIRQLFK